ncbi:MAG: hypothetical protein ACQEXJ_19050 [Myxococcota bacterium]
MKHVARVVPVLILLLAPACDSGGGDTPHSIEGDATIQADQGVDFGTGAVVDGIAVSDLYATASDGLRLTAGGPNQANARNVRWFQKNGGHRTFASLDEVPGTPLPTSNYPLPNARTGYGFIVANQRGGYTRGWIREADAGSVTVEFAPIP